MSNQRVLINSSFVADDYGMSPLVNDAIDELIVKGIVGSVSVMVSTGQSPHIFKTLNTLRETKKISIGLHWNLTEPLRIKLNYQELLRHQFDLFEKYLGQLPDHFDSHHHIHQYPILRSQVANFFVENSLHTIPIRNTAMSDFFKKNVYPKLTPASQRKCWIMNQVGQSEKKLLIKNGLTTNSNFWGCYDFQSPQDFNLQVKSFRNSNFEHNEIFMVHPAHGTSDIKKLSISSARHLEFDCLNNGGPILRHNT